MTGLMYHISFRNMIRKFSTGDCGDRDWVCEADDDWDKTNLGELYDKYTCGTNNVGI
jgi:hypothetical protein